MTQNKIETHHSFGSEKFVSKRNIHVYLPDDYFHNKAKRFPVLYLQDGQNLFDPKKSFAGVAWQVDKIADDLISKKKIQSLIIVGIENSGVDRINDYTQTSFRAKGGNADNYGRFLIEEIKPFIDKNYQTLPEREFTGLGGSSLGGLFSLYLGLKRQDVFSRLAVMSPSLWWGNAHILREFSHLPHRFPSRIWLDIGKREPFFAKHQTKHLQEILLHKGWRKNRNARLADFRYLEAPKGKHDEFSWGNRFDKVLKFLYPK
jgi:predicted alpha/beta superfamily hydrolase